MMGDDQQQLLASVFNTAYGDVIDRFADEYNRTLQLSEQLGHNRSFVRLFAYHRDRIRNGGRFCSSGGCHRQVYFSSFGGASWQSCLLEIREWCVIENLTICGRCNDGDDGFFGCSVSSVETSYVFNELYSLRHSAGNILRCPIYLITTGRLFCCLPDDPAAGDYIVRYDNTPFETYQDRIVNFTIIPVFHRLCCNFLVQWRRDNEQHEEEEIDVEEE